MVYDYVYIIFVYIYCLCIYAYITQKEYYATHQYFLTKRSLYLVVWRLTDGERGVAEIMKWLINIQVMNINGESLLNSLNVLLLTGAIQFSFLSVCLDLSKQIFQANLLTKFAY